jgi:hypothetical protein
VCQKPGKKKIKKSVKMCKKMLTTGTGVRILYIYSECETLNTEEQMKNFTHIVRNIITGSAISRHTSLELAQAAAARKTTGKNPLSIVEYSEQYWKTHK